MTQISRHRSVLLVAILLALSGFKGEAPVGAQGRGTLTGVVMHVADGDTLDITANGQAYTIRLDGIDAPERGQAFGQQARHHLRVLAFSQPATALVQNRDRYGRTVARVIVAGRDLSEEMVKAGLAWHYVRTLPTAGLPHSNNRPGNSVVDCGPIEPPYRPGSIAAIVRPVHSYGRSHGPPQRRSPLVPPTAATCRVACITRLDAGTTTAATAPRCFPAAGTRRPRAIVPTTRVSSRIGSRLPRSNRQAAELGERALRLGFWSTTSRVE
jgi:endonuclease YncB( thermonuclease family)